MLRYVQKPILVLVLIVDCTHECSSGLNKLVDKNEYCFFRGKFNTFTDDIAELSQS